MYTYIRIQIHSALTLRIFTSQIIVAGEMPDCMYMMRFGQVQLRGKGGKMRVATTGSLFGEMAILGLSPDGTRSKNKRESENVPLAHERNLVIHQYIYIYVYISSIYTYMNIYIHMYIYTHIYIYVYICIYIYLHTRIYIYVYIYIHVYIYVYMQMYLYIYIHI